MPLAPPASLDYLICRSGARLCALPLACVVETMRPLPTRPVPDMPPFLLGVSIIRGATAPVVSVAQLLGEPATAPASRLVTIKMRGRAVAFAFDAVLGIRSLAAQCLADIPLLLHALDTSSVAAIAILDAELMVVLQSARIIPDAVWATLDTAEPIV